jgi:nitrogen fixation/metabolism regulation signal transduction histidine kinase
MESWLQTFAQATFERSADTAHDLKTPLNVAVLNLELLRMRLRKLSVDGDEKIEGYTRAIEVELRRMGRIFDSYFLLASPPKNEGSPLPVDLSAICREAGGDFGFAFDAGEPAFMETHEGRIRQAFKLFFEGAASILIPATAQAATSRTDASYEVRLTGAPLSADLELPKLFKFYYSDPQGNPDLSLAVARLIAETYGGELVASSERDKVSLRLSLPLGAR